MAQLSACYFCGSIGEPLIEHPIVPDAFATGGPDEKTVAVCSTCGEKLQAVQEGIVAAIDAAHPGISGRDTSAVDVDRGTTDPGSGVRPEASGSRSDDAVAQPAVESTPDAASPSARSDVGAQGSQLSLDEFPPGTRHVIRLLQNRSFPVDRSVIEAIAEDAYDLSESEAREAIDALVEAGALVDDDGRLARPGDAE